MKTSPGLERASSFCLTREKRGNCSNTGLKVWVEQDRKGEVLLGSKTKENIPLAYYSSWVRQYFNCMSTAARLSCSEPDGSLT